MTFGVILRGNATLIGASANIVSVAIRASNSQRVSVRHFNRRAA